MNLSIDDMFDENGDIKKIEFKRPPKGYKPNFSKKKYNESLPIDRNEKILKGKIHRLFFSNDNFCSGLITIPVDSFFETVRFAGKVVVNIGDQVKLAGKWINDSKWGWQFTAENLVHDMNLDRDGLAHYLKTNPAFKGIGPVKAEKIASTFGESFGDILENNPEQIQEVAGLTNDQFRTLCLEWESRKEFNLLATWLAKYELTHNQITKLITRFGNNLKKILEKDPYILCREIDGFGFVRTDEIALKMGISKDSTERIQSALIHIVNQVADSDGHCWTEETELIKMASKLLALDNLDSEVLIDQEINALLSNEKLSVHSSSNKFVIASPLLYERETELAKMFKKSNSECLSKENNETLKNILPELFEKIAGSLNSSQQKAIETAIFNSICVITGAAGSGKSYTIGAFIDILEEMNKDSDNTYLTIEMAAPTGKAAKRMEEISNRPARTIHRLLKYDGKNWGYCRENPINADIIIIDEFSMVDVHLAWRLFSAIDLKRTQVVLVGDHNQLPPVGPGNILRDLIDRKIVPIVKLEQVVRQAGLLKRNCTAILKGVVEPTAPGTDGVLRPWYVFDRLETDQAVIQALLNTIEHKLSKIGINPTRDLQVITPTKKGKLGTENLNIELQKLFQRVFFGIEIEPVDEGKRPNFYPNDKVIQIKNDYKLDVMNGTVGTVKDVCEKYDKNGVKYTSFIIDFGEKKPVEITKGSKEHNNIILAYACTIHKYQGSEIPCVLAIVHKSHYFMLHRNLLYTAVTRSKKTVIVLGNSRGIQLAAKKQILNKRRTFLSIV